MSTTEKTAAELVDDLKTADQETLTAIVNDENAREKPRVTVLDAAEARQAELDLPGEPVKTEPSGAWAQLIDADGEPVTIDGHPVATELVV